MGGPAASRAGPAKASRMLVARGRRGPAPLAIDGMTAHLLLFGMMRIHRPTALSVMKPLWMTILGSLGLPATPCSVGAAVAGEVAKPNILWFVVDDMSANFSCYGEKLIQTPHVDRLAREGTRFKHAFVTAPVCSPCRSALIDRKSVV